MAESDSSFPVRPRRQIKYPADGDAAARPCYDNRRDNHEIELNGWGAPDQDREDAPGGERGLVR